MRDRFRAAHWAMCLLAGSLIVSCVAAEAADFSCSWATPVDGVWDDADNWSTCGGSFPNNGGGSTFDASIEATGTPYTVAVDLNVGIDKLRLDSINATLDHTGGRLRANNGLELHAGRYQLNGGRIQNTTIKQIGAFLGFRTNLFNTLANVTLEGDLVLDGTVTLVDGTIFTGDALLTSDFALLIVEQTMALDNKVIVLNGERTEFRVNMGTMTLGENVTIRLNNKNAEFESFDEVINHGTIIGDNSVGDVEGRRTISVSSFTNEGTVRAQNGAVLWVAGGDISNRGLYEALPGATLVVGGVWDNSAGIIHATDATIILHGIYTTARIGTLNRTGGTVKIGGTWDNSGASFTLDASLGDFVLDGGAIVGGVFTLTSARLLFGGSSITSRLDGVVLNGDLVMDIEDARVNLINGATFTGDALLSAPDTVLNVMQTMTLDDSTIVLEGVNSELRVDDIHTLTLGTNATVILNNDYTNIDAGAGHNTLVNNGTIVADKTGADDPQPRFIEPDTFVNNGTVTAQNGVELYVTVGQLLTLGLTNTGVIEARDGATLFLGEVQNDVTNTDGGMVRAIDATMILEGNWDNSGGSIAGTNSTVTFARRFTNAADGNIFAVNSTIEFPGDLIVNEEGLVNLGSLNLTDATVNGDVHSPVGSTINVAGTVTFRGVVSGGVSFSGSDYHIVFSGKYSTGDDPTLISFEGDVDFDTTNILVLKLDGSAPGTEHDRLEIAGAAALGGVLELLTDNLIPAFGESFVLLTWANRTGEFASINGVQNASEIDLAVSYESGALVVRAVSQGDVNGDGVVNFADAAIVAANQGVVTTAYTAGDVDGSGIVDSDDAAIVKAALPVTVPIGWVATLMLLFLITGISFASHSLPREPRFS